MKVVVEAAPKVAADGAPKFPYGIFRTEISIRNFPYRNFRMEFSVRKVAVEAAPKVSVVVLQVVLSIFSRITTRQPVSFVMLSVCQTVSLSVCHCQFISLIIHYSVMQWKFQVCKFVWLSVSIRCHFINEILSFCHFFGPGVNFEENSICFPFSGCRVTR